MSEWKWIDRRDREPEDGVLVLTLWETGEPVVIGTPMSPTRRYWMPIPPPPPRMVTIEVHEWVADALAAHCWSEDAERALDEARSACRDALAKREGQ